MLRHTIRLAALLCAFPSALHAEQLDSLLETADRAMNNHLWDVATLKLDQASRIEGINDEQRSNVLVLLAESLVRGNKPSVAAEILEQSVVSSHPHATFWLGQALAGEGKFSKAVETLLPIAADPSHPLQTEAALTAASLQLSLGQPRPAHDTLELLEESSDPAAAILSRLRRVEILIDLRSFGEARELFPERSQIQPDQLPLADFLEAHLLLGEGKLEEAELAFTALLVNPEGQSLTHHSHAAIGRADALALQGDPQAAINSLFSFLQEKTDDIPLLDPMFSRILEWLPETLISAEHPVLVRLAEWSPPTSPPGSAILNATAEKAAAAWPVRPVPITERAAHALYTRALGLHRIQTTAARGEAKLLLNRLRQLSPQHELSQRSLLKLAQWELEAGDADRAFALLDTLRHTATSPDLKGEAAFRDAKIALERGDSSLATALFAEAASILEGPDKDAALFNASLARLRENPGEVVLIQNEDSATASVLNVDLELEKALLIETPAEARAALDSFLTRYPSHPRSPEARLAIIEAALASTPPDTGLARAQLETLRASTIPLPLDQAPRLALAELRIQDVTGDSENAILTATQLIADYPETPVASEASLVLGKTLFRTGNYNDARLILEKLASADPDSQRSQAALLLAARAAALGATAQSREEALALFDRARAIDGPLKTMALLEKAHLNIDLNRLPVAIASLTEAYEATAADDPSRIPTGLLLAEAIYAQGDTNPQSLTQALRIYDDLLALTPDTSPRFFRIQYLRGLTLERLPDPEDPASTREADARLAYFSVLDRPADSPPPEWEWFERSGFRYLTLLENAEEWEAAVSIAEKIASFEGPRSEEASTRARQLRLKHMIWND